MRKTGFCTVLALFAFCLMIMAGPQSAYADTLQLVSVGSNTAGGVYTYPYYFSVNGGPGTTPLMCISYFNHVTIGEEWKVYTLPVTTVPEKEAAWLLNDAIANPSDDVKDNLAAWELFDSRSPSGGAAQLALADAFVVANPNSPLYSDFVFYIPVGDSLTFPQDTKYPQIYIGETPEPSSLLLLGTGLLGLAFLVFRKAGNRSSNLVLKG